MQATLTQSIACELRECVSYSLNRLVRALGNGRNGVSIRITDAT